MYGALQKVIIDKEILENMINNQQQQIEALQQQVQLLLSKI